VCQFNKRIKGEEKEMMIVSFLLIGWILSWFKFESFFIQAFQELFNKEITIASYYFVFFCVGAIGDLILFFNGDYINRFFS
jgi:hypothetical protein